MKDKKYLRFIITEANHFWELLAMKDYIFNGGHGLYK